VKHYATNRPGLVVSFWGLALVLGRVQISQTDQRGDGSVFGSILNHVTVGRHTDGELVGCTAASDNFQVFLPQDCMA
jgi:hypothetical protein